MAQAPSTESRDRVRGTVPKLIELSETVLFGDVWERPQLSKRDRMRAAIKAAAFYTRWYPKQWVGLPGGSAISGKLGDHVSKVSVERASTALVERITTAARERLPAAIAEFDVGGLVRKKVSDYPTERLEALVLSVASHHLKTIELFGAVIGFVIGVGQALYFWFSPAINSWLGQPGR